MSEDSIKKLIEVEARKMAETMVNHQPKEGDTVRME